MTEPDDLDEPNASQLDEQRRVRDLLRDEPVDVDPVRRDAAIAAALEAASEPVPDSVTAVSGVGGATSTAPPRRARRSGRVLRPVLVAAATIAVVAGGVAALGNLGSGSSADMAGEAETAHESTASGAGSAGGNETAGDTDSAGAQDAAETTTTTAAGAPTVAEATSTPDLGDFEDTDTLLDTAATTLGSASFRSPPRGDADEQGLAHEDAERLLGALGMPCLEAAATSGTVPAATARVHGRAVLVALGDGVLVVFDASTCSELARR